MKRLGRVRRLLAVLLLAVSVMLVSGCAGEVEVCYRDEKNGQEICIRGKGNSLAEGFYANIE